MNLPKNPLQITAKNCTLGVKLFLNETMRIYIVETNLAPTILLDSLCII